MFYEPTGVIGKLKNNNLAVCVFFTLCCNYGNTKIF